MKVKNGDFMNLIQAMNEVLPAELPNASVKTRYLLGKAGKKLAKEHEDFTKLRISICEKYCDRDENGKPIMENQRYTGLENNEAYKKEMEELMEIEFEINFTPMKLSELEGSKPVISPISLTVLEELGFMEIDIE